MIIRGGTVSTPIKPERNLVKATNLNEEEKAQARANIGAAIAYIDGSYAAPPLVLMDLEPGSYVLNGTFAYSSNPENGQYHFSNTLVQIDDVDDGQKSVSFQVADEIVCIFFTYDSYEFKRYCLADMGDVVKTVNGVAPDENGNVQVETGGADNELVEQLEERVLNLDGFVPIDFEQGALLNANGAESPSNYNIRTKQYIERSLIKSIAVNEGYNFRLYFYKENKTFSAVGGWNSTAAITNQDYYARILINNNAGVTPESDHGFVFKSSINSVDDKITAVDKNIGNLANSIILEQGSLMFSGGAETPSGTYIRNSGFIPYDGAYKITANDGYELKLFYYDTNKEQIIISDVRYTTLASGFGEYVLPYIASAKYIRFSIQNESKTNIDISADVGVKVYGLATYREELYRSQVNRNIVQQLKPQFPAVTACLGKTTEFYKSNFGAICVADFHGSFTSLDDAYAVQQYLSRYYSNQALPILCVGDNVPGRTKEGGVISEAYNTYIAKAIQYGVYHTIGQHEVGFYDTTAGRSKTNCMTHDEVFEKFIAPMKEVWELPDLTTNYYCKDFANAKMRLISLYQYNVPLVEESSTVWKYWRAAIWYGQEQLDWLVNTLNSTPDGYNVIILMHQPENAVNNTENTPFFHGNLPSVGGMGIIDGTPVVDIVEAYRNRTTLNKTYVCKDKTKYPEADFSNSVVADFTNAKGTFANYFTGDAHVDYFGSVGETTQKNFGVTSSGQSYDVALRSDNGDSTIASMANNPESTILTIIGYDYDRTMARICRLGQQFASDGTMRVYTAIKY